MSIRDCGMCVCVCWCSTFACEKVGARHITSSHNITTDNILQCYIHIGSCRYLWKDACKSEVILTFRSCNSHSLETVVVQPDEQFERRMFGQWYLQVADNDQLQNIAEFQHGSASQDIGKASWGPLREVWDQKYPRFQQFLVARQPMTHVCMCVRERESRW